RSPHSWSCTRSLDVAILGEVRRDVTRSNPPVHNQFMNNCDPDSTLWRKSRIPGHLCGSPRGGGRIGHPAAVDDDLDAAVHRPALGGLVVTDRVARAHTLGRDRIGRYTMNDEIFAD